VPKKPTVTFSEALNHLRTCQLLDEPTRVFALAMLTSGLRLSEALKVNGATMVIGKGGKARQVYNAPLTSDGVSIKRLRTSLATVGLTPHMLRKLAATQAVELGAREADLLAMFGWSSAQTASYYVQATKTGDIAAKMKELTNGKQ
jgi:integrase